MWGSPAVPPSLPEEPVHTLAGGGSHLAPTQTRVWRALGLGGLSLPWTHRQLHTSPEPDRAGARGHEPVKPKAPENEVFLYSARKIKFSWNRRTPVESLESP